MTTFWSPIGAGSGLDPKTLYEPINDRWIVTALTDFPTANSGIGIGVSRSPARPMPACLRFTGADQNAVTAAGLSDDPSAAGGLYWYLVTGVNVFGEGPAGNATVGPRLINSSGA